MNEYDYMNYMSNIPNKMNMNYTTNSIGYNQNMYNMMPKNTLTEISDGFIKGNMFKNMYEPYKHFKPMEINPKNEKDALMYQLMQYKFALIELDLYLDTNPNDTEMIKLYNNYLNIEKQICDKYESMYGPITLGSEYLNKNMWAWNNNWPWEVK